mmetsp:Transcript_35844/g.41836  ORF Transcript_35844/g.41836 Transcript_35844/m.41836 type:complete len:515 (+) Transcript_35844:48-1592(+)
MPPKKTFNRDESDDDDDTSVDTSSTDDDVPPPKKSTAPAPNASGAAGRGVVNKPHDEEFDVGGDDQVKTPPNGSLKKPTPSSTTQATVTPAGKPGGNILRNRPDDEEFHVDDDERVKTPPNASQSGGAAPAPAAQTSGKAPAAAASGKGGHLRNNPNDYYENADDEGVDTPPRPSAKPSAAGAVSNLQDKKPSSLSEQQIQNDHHDLAIDVSDNSGSPSSTYGSATPGSTQKAAPQAKPVAAIPQGKMSMVRQNSDESESSEEEEDDGAAANNANNGPKTGNPATLGTAASKPPPVIEYNPADYASINQRASREMQELFISIASYQPVIQELPSKLRPFIPDFIPSVGDLDPFCKIPRPDGRPDNLGLFVIDEPCANQSNPAVVKIGLQYITRGHIPSVFVDCVEDAANRPTVIDKWVADIKKLHYKKPLPTVNYSKPMPEIESLLQVWPQDFEELLNSDLQFPPTQIDLDIDQYVRVMCAVLDIPTYGSLIESLHVMFTLYCEFRANQHFQHA